MAQRSSVGGNPADVTSTSTNGKSNTTSNGINPMPGVLTRAQSQSQATRDADTMPNSKGGSQGSDGVHLTGGGITCGNLKVCAWNCEGWLQKLDLKEVVYFLRSFDIFSLSEMFVDSNNNMTRSVIMTFLFQNLQSYRCKVGRRKVY